MKKPYETTGSRNAKDLTYMTHPNLWKMLLFVWFFQLVVAIAASLGIIFQGTDNIGQLTSSNSSTILNHPLPSIRGWGFPSAVRRPFPQPASAWTDVTRSAWMRQASPGLQGLDVL